MEQKMFTVQCSVYGLPNNTHFIFFFKDKLYIVHNIKKSKFEPNNNRSTQSNTKKKTLREKIVK